MNCLNMTDLQRQQKHVLPVSNATNSFRDLPQACVALFKEKANIAKTA